MNGIVYFLIFLTQNITTFTTNFFMSSPISTTLCNNECKFYIKEYKMVDISADGICDDGGEGSEYHLVSSLSNLGLWNCSLGDDCEDCGPRIVLNELISSPSPSPSPSPSTSSSPTPSPSPIPSSSPSPSLSKNYIMKIKDILEDEDNLFEI